MSGVEANAHAIWIFHLSDDLGEVFQFISERSSLPRRDFQTGDHFRIRRRDMRLVERLGNLLEADFLPFAKMRAGMRDEIWNLKLRAAGNFLDKQCNARPAHIFFWRSEIDQ